MCACACVRACVCVCVCVCVVSESMATDNCNKQTVSELVAVGES